MDRHLIIEHFVATRLVSQVSFTTGEIDSFPLTTVATHKNRVLLDNAPTVYSQGSSGPEPGTATLPLQSLGLGRSGSAPLLNHVLHVRHDVLLVESFLLG